MDLQVQVTQNCPQRYVNRVRLLWVAPPQDGECWTNLRSWSSSLRDRGHGKGQYTGSLESQLWHVQAAVWPWVSHLPFLGLGVSSVTHKGSLPILRPLGSLGTVCFNKAACQEQATVSPSTDTDPHSLSHRDQGETSLLKWFSKLDWLRCVMELETPGHSLGV